MLLSFFEPFRTIAYGENTTSFPNCGPRALVLQYVISSEGTNVQEDCHNVHLFDYSLINIAV
jgi:hypothetical protein